MLLFKLFFEARHNTDHRKSSSKLSFKCFIRSEFQYFVVLFCSFLFRYFYWFYQYNLHHINIKRHVLQNYDALLCLLLNKDCMLGVFQIINNLTLLLISSVPLINHFSLAFKYESCIVKVFISKNNHLGTIVSSLSFLKLQIASSTNFNGKQVF